MSLGQSWNVVLTLFGATLTFYIQTWDEYYTQTLILGIVSGPVEGILTLCIVYAVTAVKGGGSFWQQSLLQTVGVSKHSAIPEAVYDMAWNEWYMVYGGLVLVFNTLSRYDLPFPVPSHRGYKAHLPASSINHVLQVQRKEGKPIEPPLYGLIPYFITWLFVPTYLYLNPVILNHHLIPFVFYIGLINAYSVGQIIVKHLTKDSKFPMYNVLTLPLAVAVLDSMGPFLGLWPSALGGGTYQIAFYDIITTICDYLDIWCLTIKHPSQEEEQKKLQ
ncbi:MAG: hypothetical protein Q9217_004570 [Psora testacea]